MDTIIAAATSCEVRAVIHFFMQKDEVWLRFIVDCVMYMVIML
jgi:hypothetical protein